MKRQTWSRWGAGLVVLGCGLASAEERPVVRTQVSAFAAQRNSLDPEPELQLGLNLGVALRARAQDAVGWHFGADVSLSLMDAETAHLDVGAPLGLHDQGSSLFVAYQPEGWAPGEGVSLTVYPADSSRLRLGWAQPATWGGNFFGRFEQTSRGRVSTPAAVLQARGAGWHVFAALKTPGWLDSLAPMVGAGVSLPMSLRAEVQAAHLQRHHYFYPGLVTPDDAQFGDAPLQEPPTTGLGKPYVQGASARLVHARGEAIGNPVDFGLYGRAPTLFDEVLRPEPSSEGVSHSVSLEATHAVMYTNWGNTPLKRRTHTNLLALDARLRWNGVRLFALGLVRGAGAVVMEDSYLWSDYTRGTRRRAELGMSLGADYHLASLGLTPGLGLRVVRPAAHLRPANAYSEASWWLISSEGLARVLPQGSEPRPVMSARASLKWNLLRQVSAVGELAYTWAGHSLTGAGPSLSYADAVANGSFFGPQRGAAAVLDSEGLDFNLLVQTRF
ncbi:MAG TPA: hypothetical protein VE153_17495 [Myxococcus sp.]|nr:hypothetical protein [Myxococcus sp.]